MKPSAYVADESGTKITDIYFNDSMWEREVPHILSEFNIDKVEVHQVPGDMTTKVKLDKMPLTDYSKKIEIEFIG